MKRSGAGLAKYALEQLPLQFIVAEQGAQHQLLYQELVTSTAVPLIELPQIRLAPYVAQAAARVSDKVGCVLVTANAGTTELISGIAQAFHDGIPLLLLAEGEERDLPAAKQSLSIDHSAMLADITKESFVVESYDLIVPTLFEAFVIANDGEPGPVYVEIPRNIQQASAELENLTEFVRLEHEYAVDDQAIEQALALLDAAERPCILVGSGSRQASEIIADIATHLAAPVITTLQGADSFPGDHPLHAGCTLGITATDLHKNLFEGCDCLLVIGSRLRASATQKFSALLPENLIHIDIDPQAFNRHYPARIALQGDAKTLAQLLLDKICFALPRRDNQVVAEEIAAGKSQVKNAWRGLENLSAVNPAQFFDELQLQLESDAFIFVEDTNLRQLAASLFSYNQPGCFHSTAEFEGRDFAFSSAIGAKLTQPNRQTVVIVNIAQLIACFGLLSFAQQNSLSLLVVVVESGESANQRGETTTKETANAESQVSLLLQHQQATYSLINNNQEIASKLSNAIKHLAEGTQIVEIILDSNSPSVSAKSSFEATKRAKTAIESKVKSFGRKLLKKLFK